MVPAHFYLWGPYDAVNHTRIMQFKTDWTYVLTGVKDRAALADEDVSGNDIFIYDTATTR